MDKLTNQPINCQYGARCGGGSTRHGDNRRSQFGRRIFRRSQFGRRIFHRSQIGRRIFHLVAVGGTILDPAALRQQQQKI